MDISFCGARDPLAPVLIEGSERSAEDMGGGLWSPAEVIAVEVPVGRG